MKPGTRTPEFLFWLLAVLGAIGTQAQLPAYLPLGFVPGTIAFWKDALANPAGVFLVADIFVLGAAMFVWMLGECRRLAMRGAWIYLLGALLIGISIFVPIFFAMRERKLHADTASGVWRLEGSDWIAIVLMLAMSGAAVVYSLMHMPGMAPP